MFLLRSKNLLEEFIGDNSSDPKSISLYLNCLIELSQYEDAKEFISSLSNEIRNSKEVKNYVKCRRYCKGGKNYYSRKQQG